MDVWRFSPHRFRHAFWLRKTSKKPLKNHARATQKSTSGIMFFSTTFFWVSAQFWSNLGVQNGTQNCTFGPPKLRCKAQSTAYSVRIAFFVFFALNLKFAMKKRKT